MLVELTVQNLAVVEDARIRLEPGLNMLTGETGSGKSIVVDALALLFGGRASADVIRSGSERARVAGIFEIDDRDTSLTAFLSETGIDTESGELLIEREVTSNGKSRAFAGGRLVTAAVLRQLSGWLGDIHGQHDQQNLSSPELQREMLDEKGNHSEFRLAVASAYRDWRQCTVELDELDRNEQEKLRLADLWGFQAKEIDAARLSPNEDVRLENERSVLRNAGKIGDAASAAYAALYDSESSVSAGMRLAIKKLEEIARYDSSVAGSIEALRSASVSVEDTATVLRDYVDRVEADPKRLDEVESRLDLLERLKRKYGTSLEAILAFGDEVRAKLSALESAEERRARLLKDRERLEGGYRDAAARLTAKRREAGTQLCKKVETELASLALNRARLEVRVEPAAWAEHGADTVQFLLSANPGEEPRALDRVASGGELSRIALALKTAVASKNARKGRTLVFDEVDAGIGGGAADAVGRRLKKLASRDQILCVTHLPQVASFADHHFRVEKRVDKGRTFTVIEQLDREGRTREVARMLSGEKLTEEARKNAEKLIQTATAAG